MCVSWLVRVCVVTVWCMTACAIVSGFAAGVFSATDVDAKACRACSPSGVRLAVRWERRVALLGLRGTYRCERVGSATV
jgi:hypothetical protein